MKNNFIVLSSLAIIITGCASTGVVPADKGTYIISKQSAAGIFGTPGGVKADIYTEANDFCKSTNKTVETIKIEVKDAVPFVRTGSASLEFKCVSQ